ncbi:MAG: molecular chaperone HtpG [Planctomycetota bacterium]|nr:molecular chaperone HtpG [Planctomycetota bacterium]
MTQRPETHVFQAEVKELLGLMIHSLYSHKEIFLRELISNASDALDKLRFEALTKPELASGGDELCIRLDVDAQARRIVIADNGIGMTREEVIENLGTIARSGTRRFLEALRAKGSQSPELIGQFGVGFYSSFMVAERIVVETRKAGTDGGVCWTSRGDGEFTLEPTSGLERGTRITLDLKPLPQDEEDAQDFADAYVLRELVKKYSDFVEWPILMPTECLPDERVLRRRPGPGGVEVVELNSKKPLWSRPKDEIKPEEYAQFYHHLAHDFADPLETVHFRNEGSNEYTALLYVPGARPFDLFEPGRDKSQVALYVRRVFVMGECEELLPPWLRFVRGVVDSSDLPLNVSREILQQNRTLVQIKKRCTTKVLEALGAMRDNRRADYEKFWAAFGTVLKEGLVMERERTEELAALCLFPTTKDGTLVTLDELIARVPKDQDTLYTILGSDLETVRRSPHLEALAAKGGEALCFTDPIDEWVRDALREYKGKKLVALERGEAEFGGAADKEHRETMERDYRGVLERIEHGLTGSVERVRFSTRLKDSPAVLVDSADAPGPHYERMLRQTGRPVPPRKRVLELNADHPLTAKLKSLFEADAQSGKLKDWADLLYGQALLAEGSPLPDAPRFSRLVSELMLASAK